MAGRSSASSRKLMRLLSRLPEEVAKPIKAEIRRAALVIRNEAKSLVPGKYRHTGQLARSIRMRSYRRGLGAVVFTESRYGHLVEKGTKPHSLGPGHGNHPGARPYPYLYKARDRERRRYRSNIMKAVNTGIRRTADGA